MQVRFRTGLQSPIGLVEEAKAAPEVPKQPDFELVCSINRDWHRKRRLRQSRRNSEQYSKGSRLIEWVGSRFYIGNQSSAQIMPPRAELFNNLKYHAKKKTNNAV